MKTILVPFLFSAFQLICGWHLYAQESHNGSEQHELINVLTGTWEGKLAGDTVCTWHFVSYGNNSLENNITCTLGNEIVREGKELWGYDIRNKQFMVARLYKGKVTEFWRCKAITNDIGELVRIDPFDPESTLDKWLYEIRGTNTFIETQVTVSKRVEYTFKKVRDE
jgi:hypothetical protein